MKPRFQRLTMMMNNLERYLVRHVDSFEADSSRLLRETAYERLKDAIRYADLQPGEVLSEVSLSKALGISRTPVREAVRQLAQEGLIEIIPGRAIIIPRLSVQEVREVVHMRSLLEPELARLAANSVTSEQVESLRGFCRKMQKAAENDDRMAWSKADARFHETLTSTCPSQYLGRTVFQLSNRMHDLAVISRTSQARLIACTEEHWAVVQAIAVGDSQAAARTMAEHIAQQRNNLLGAQGADWFVVSEASPETA
jgi:DNA-binding GntR family transcriptional regulator